MFVFVMLLCCGIRQELLAQASNAARAESPLQSPRFEVFTAVNMKAAVPLDVTPCGSCKNQRLLRKVSNPSPGCQSVRNDSSN
jgi:hypothetical protein